MYFLSLNASDLTLVFTFYYFQFFSFFLIFLIIFILLGRNQYFILILICIFLVELGFEIGFTPAKHRLYCLTTCLVLLTLVILEVGSSDYLQTVIFLISAFQVDGIASMGHLLSPWFEMEETDAFLFVVCIYCLLSYRLQKQQPCLVCQCQCYLCSLELQQNRMSSDSSVNAVANAEQVGGHCLE